MSPLPEELSRQVEQLVKPEGVEPPVENTVETKPVTLPETAEALREQLLQQAKEVGVAAVRSDLATAEVDYLRRLGNTQVDQVRAEAMAAVNQLFADLAAELAQLDPTAQSIEPLPTPEPTIPTASPETPVLKPVLPSIDGVRPPEDGAAGDNEEFEETKTVTEEAAVVTAVETVDQFADRNAASQAVLNKLLQPDLSIPGYSNMELLKDVRELLIARAHDGLVIRTDFEGNLIIGVPEDDGNGLKIRLITLHHDTDQGTVDWLRRSMRSELATLDRYQITVIDDPNLDHTEAALAA